MRRRRVRVGDVVEIALPDGRFAYGRVLRDACIAFYREMTVLPGRPPIGTRDYLFVVGVYDDLPGRLFPVVGHDPSKSEDDDEPPPMSVRDEISGSMSIYHKGEMVPANRREAEKLEPAAVWDAEHIIERLTASTTDVH